MNFLKIIRVGLFVTLVAGLSAGASELVQNIRVVWSGDAQTEAVVVWDSADENESSVLMYDTVSRADGTSGYEFETPVIQTGPYIPGLGKDSKETAPSAPKNPDFFYHHAELNNLEPDTLYYLAVKTGKKTGREYHFKTAPDEGTPFKLIYAGDSRTHLDVTRQMSMNIRKMITEDDSITALLHGGDFANVTIISEWKNWLDAYELTTTEEGKLLPIIPIIGNHDIIGKSPIFGQAYGNPGGTNFYFVTKLTPYFQIVCLNTERDAGGAQKEFLMRALYTMDTENVRWRIVALHSPLYPAVKGIIPAKSLWVPLLEEFQVDLVLESDGHCIKRTVPILNDKEHPDGVVYLGEGGYGAPQRDAKMDRWYLQGTNAFVSKGDHIMMLEITPDEIFYSTLLSNGEIVDSAVFKPRQPAPPAIVIE